ncbi:hypothetical protein PIB30_091125 [Stylosanthes scabra]|uniref:Uncharacterized protein n=1 Tax=Stylosanthes scabra TaxID=79078 RepID=A0ABU6UTX0_9FABA|nr:hypothetical protein [Stylosanthes scabra]
MSNSNPSPFSVHRRRRHYWRHCHCRDACSFSSSGKGASESAEHAALQSMKVTGATLAKSKAEKGRSKETMEMAEASMIKPKKMPPLLGLFFFARSRHCHCHCAAAPSSSCGCVVVLLVVVGLWWCACCYCGGATTICDGGGSDEGFGAFQDTKHFVSLKVQVPPISLAI